MLGKHVRLQWIDAREMHETQPASPSRIRSAFERDRSMRKIPVREVVAGIAFDVDIGKHSRHQIDPLLVGEQSCLDIGVSAVFELARPPSEQIAPRSMRTDSEEPEVVRAGTHDLQFARMMSILERRDQMTRGDGGIVEHARQAVEQRLETIVGAHARLHHLRQRALA